MLEIAKSNSKTSNNSIRLAAAKLVISITRLVATTFAVLIIAAPFKLTALIVSIATTPLKYSAYKAIRGYAASSLS
jgi:hypothetical protein